jgi:hypothetical protein
MDLLFPVYCGTHYTNRTYAAELRITTTWRVRYSILDQVYSTLMNPLHRVTGFWNRSGTSSNLTSRVWCRSPQRVPEVLVTPFRFVGSQLSNTFHLHTRQPTSERGHARNVFAPLARTGSRGEMAVLEAVCATVPTLLAAY